jgi:excisionase family DNA binding protein
MNLSVATLLAELCEAVEKDPTLAARVKALFAPEADPYVKMSDSGIAAGTVRRAVRAGELKVYRVGRDHFLRRADVTSYIQRRQRVTKVAPVEGDEAAQLLAHVRGRR